MTDDPAVRDRVIRLPDGGRIFYDRLTPTQRAAVDPLLRELLFALEREAFTAPRPSRWARLRRLLRFS